MYTLIQLFGFLGNIIIVTERGHIPTTYKHGYDYATGTTDDLFFLTEFTLPQKS